MPAVYPSAAAITSTSSSTSRRYVWNNVLDHFFNEIYLFSIGLSARRECFGESINAVWKSRGSSSINSSNNMIWYPGGGCELGVASVWHSNETVRIAWNVVADITMEKTRFKPFSSYQKNLFSSSDYSPGGNFIDSFIVAIEQCPKPPIVIPNCQLRKTYTS